MVLRDARLFAGLSQQNPHFEFLVTTLKVFRKFLVGAFAPADVFVEIVFHPIEALQSAEVSVCVNSWSRLTFGD
jgi:hypothetical protein